MPKRRRGTDSIRDSFVVETPDGGRLRCSIAAVGRETEPRWMIMDEDGAQFVGPPVSSDHDGEAVSRQIEEWWAARATKPAPPAASAAPSPKDSGE